MISMTQYHTPSQDQVLEALRRIPTPQLKRAFFEGLNNPLWLQPLFEAGIFATPPEQVIHSDGSHGDPYWPALEYLTRVAPDAPAIAVDAILALSDESNVWIRRAAFAIATSTPPEEAVRLIPAIKQWSRSTLGWRTDPTHLIAYCVRLLSYGYRTEGLWLADALLNTRTSADHTATDPLLDEYWYSISMSRIAPLLDASSLGLVIGWLSHYDRANGGPNAVALIRTTIAEPNNTYHRLEDSLVDAVRDVAGLAFFNEPEATATTLIDAGLTITHRIAMYLCEQAIQASLALATSAQRFIRSAELLLFETREVDELVRVEFGLLARALNEVSPTSMSAMNEFLSRGPDVGIDVLTERLRRTDDNNDAEATARAETFICEWRHSWLSAVGHEALPEVLQAELSELDSMLGPIQDPLRRPITFTSWTGPNSPMTVEDLAAMTPDQLLDHLRTWHHEGDGWGPEPSHEGQARALTTLVTNAPNSLTITPSTSSQLRPTYIRAILNGWQGALKLNTTLEWKDVAILAQSVLNHSRDSDWPTEGGRLDDDDSFDWSKQSAVSLLTELVKKQPSVRQIPDAALIEFARILISFSDVYGYEAYSAHDHGETPDPMTVSLNWEWPLRIKGLTNLIEHGPDAEWGGAARQALAVELDKPDPIGASRAVLGEAIGRLYSADESWVNRNVEAIFGSEEPLTLNDQIALACALGAYHYHHKLFSLLEPRILGAIRQATPLASGWRGYGTPEEAVGSWVIKSVIFGDRSVRDSTVVEYYTTTDADQRGKALGSIAWQFSHSDIVSEAILDKYAEFWDERIAFVRENHDSSDELRDFYWVVRCDKYEASWWLPRMEEVLQLCRTAANGRGLIGRKLAEAASIDARRAFNVLMLMLDSHGDSAVVPYDLARNAVTVVIARALVSQDYSLQAEATMLMNRLGEAGYLDLQDEVQDVMVGKITDADVDD
ncbi:hypothetical protein JOE37_002780 [Clavibacter michiganensis]|nr:hypothetical protein [Clavibacter michiganensis]